MWFVFVITAISGLFWISSRSSGRPGWVCPFCLDHFDPCLAADTAPLCRTPVSWLQLSGGAGGLLKTRPWGLVQSPLTVVLWLPGARFGTPSSMGATSSSSWASSPSTRAWSTTTASPSLWTSSALPGVSNPCSEMAHGGKLGQRWVTHWSSRWTQFTCPGPSVPGSARRCAHQLNKYFSIIYGVWNLVSLPQLTVLVTVTHGKFFQNFSQIMYVSWNAYHSQAVLWKQGWVRYKLGIRVAVMKARRLWEKKVALKLSCLAWNRKESEIMHPHT